MAAHGRQPSQGAASAAGPPKAGRFAASTLLGLFFCRRRLCLVKCRQVLTSEVIRRNALTHDAAVEGGLLAAHKDIRDFHVVHARSTCVEERAYSSYAFLRAAAAPLRYGRAGRRRHRQAAAQRQRAAVPEAARQPSQRVRRAGCARADAAAATALRARPLQDGEGPHRLSHRGRWPPLEAARATRQAKGITAFQVASRTQPSARRQAPRNSYDFCSICRMSNAMAAIGHHNRRLSSPIGGCRWNLSPRAFGRPAKARQGPLHLARNGLARAASSCRRWLRRPTSFWLRV